MFTSNSNNSLGVFTFLLILTIKRFEKIKENEENIKYFFHCIISSQLRKDLKIITRSIGLAQKVQKIIHIYTHI